MDLGMAGIVVTDQQQDKLDEAVRNLGADDENVLAVAADLTVDTDVTQLANAVQARFGDLDILVRAAGIAGAQGLFHEIDQDGWVKTIEVGVLRPTRMLGPGAGQLRPLSGDDRARRVGPAGR